MDFTDKFTCQNTDVNVKQPRAFGNIERRLSKLPAGGQNHDSDQHATISYTSQELNFIPLELDSGELFFAAGLRVVINCP